MFSGFCVTTVYLFVKVRASNLENFDSKIYKKGNFGGNDQHDDMRRKFVGK